MYMSRRVGLIFESNFEYNFELNIIYIKTKTCMLYAATPLPPPHSSIFGNFSHHRSCLGPLVYQFWQISAFGIVNISKCIPSIKRISAYFCVAKLYCSETTNELA